MIALFCAPSSFAQAKPGKRSAIPSGKCAVTVRDDLIPKKSVVVVGCDSFGVSQENFQDWSTGGLVVLDKDLNLLFKWNACTACGGFFSRFAGIKKFRGRNALMVSLYNGPRSDIGNIAAQLTLPLYFNGKEFKFAEMPSP
jgi:hypothetical protein